MQQSSCSYKQSGSGATMSGSISIGSGNEGDLQSAVANVGPIAVAVDASSSGFRVCFQKTEFSGRVLYTRSSMLWSGTQLKMRPLSLIPHSLLQRPSLFLPYIYHFISLYNHCYHYHACFCNLLTFQIACFFSPTTPSTTLRECIVHQDVPVLS